MPSRMLVSCSNISITLNDLPLVQGVSLSVAAGEFLALVGANGCGKSTLLALIESELAGEPRSTDPSAPIVSGDVRFPSGIALASLPQMVRQAETTDEETDPRAVKIATRLGLDDAARPVDALSDGELQKLVLAQVIATESDLLLLDEPTNYLDITGLTALETHLNHLRRRGTGILCVTHDRTLTDNLADETVLMTRERCYRVPGGASAVWAARSDDLESRQHQAGAIRRKIRQLQEDAQRKASWADSKEATKRGAGSAKPGIAKQAAKLNKRAKQAQWRTDREVEKLEKTKPFVPKNVHLSLPGRTVRTRQVFSLEEVAFSYDRERALLSDISLGARAIDKLCLMGTNGAGKSTLLKLIVGELTPIAGRASHNSSVPLAVVPQGLQGFFDREPLLANFDDCPQKSSEVRKALGAVQLRRDKVLEPVASFSYGELMRAAVVKALLLGAEFLILDEPTSHLDIESIHVLEDVMQEFDGGFLIVSHDRSFVSAVADRLYVLEEGRLRLV